MGTERGGPWSLLLLLLPAPLEHVLNLLGHRGYRLCSGFIWVPALFSVFVVSHYLLPYCPDSAVTSSWGCCRELHGVPPPLPTKLLSACADALYVNTAVQDLLSISFVPNLALAARLSNNEKNRQNPCPPFITNLPV